MKYSITLNFFISEKIISKLKTTKISRNCVFDWRKTNLCHCTIKAISLSEKIPKEIKLWAKKSEKFFSKIKPFEVEINGLGQFPETIFAHVYSKELLKIHKKLCQIFPSSQPHFEGKKYVPHVSLATGAQNMPVPKKHKGFGKFKVTEVQLMVWNLNDLKKSKVYKSYKLKKRNKMRFKEENRDLLQQFLYSSNGFISIDEAIKRAKKQQME